MKIGFLYLCSFNYKTNMYAGPFGLSYLAACLEKECNINQFKIEVNVDRLIAYKPDIVGVSAFTGTYTQSIKDALRIKYKLKIPIIIGGPHITALPQNLHPVFDVGVIGEGENVIGKLINLYKQNSVSSKNLNKISNIVYHKDNQKVITKNILPISDLDSIPFPKREIMTTYWPPLNKNIQWLQTLFTSRGCPFKCIFCIRSKSKEKIRYHSPQRVIQEIIHIARFYPSQRTIAIQDELLILNKERLFNIASLIKSENLHKRFSFITMAKASLIDEEICSILQSMNVQMLVFGLESGSDKVLKYLKGKDSSVKKNHKALELATKYGFNIGGYFIVGSPIETIEDITKTYWFIQRHKPLIVSSIYYLTPFPGNKYWDYALKKGAVKEDNYDWETYDYIEFDPKNSIFLNQNYKKEDFILFHKELKKLITISDNIMDIFDQDSILKRNHFVYSEFKKIIPSDVKSILEITGLKNNIFEEYLPNLKITKLNPLDCKEKNLKLSKYDLIFFNQSLEMIKDTFEFIKKLIFYLKNNGYIMINFYNACFIDFISNIITNKWENSMWRFPHKDNLRFFTLNDIRNLLLRLNFEILEIRRNIVDIKPYSYIYSIINNYNIKFKKELNIQNFLVISKSFIS